jgi:vacuolar protein sorting-associated protein 13A/C
MRHTSFYPVSLTSRYPEHGVLFIKYCSILLQALTIQADEDFLYAVYELSKIRGASWEEEQRQ